MIINLRRYSGGGKTPPVYSYTGTSEYIDEGNGNWTLKLTTSGDLNITKLGNARFIDIFAVGPGSDGQAGAWDTITSGGNGGECKTLKNVKLSVSSYAVVIGQGDTPTSFGSEVVANKDGEGIGTKAFGESSGILYGVKGADGGYVAPQSGYDGDDADPNTGNGGGGGNYSQDSFGIQTGRGGYGGTGIIIIRNHRK